MTQSPNSADAGVDAYVRVHVAPLLRNPLNLVYQADAAERARHCTTVVAEALRIDHDPVERLLGDLLAANLPNSVGDLIDRLQDIDCLPGYSGLEHFNVDRFCDFLCDAARRSRAAEDKAAPPTPIFAYPKSASAFVAAVMGDVIDVPVGIATFQHWLGVKPWAAFVARRPFAIHEHCVPTDENVDLLYRAGCRKLVLHMRDPRQVVISFAHHVLRPEAPARLKEQYAGHGFAEVIDRLIDQYVLTQCFWLEHWRGETCARGIDILLTTFERMNTDPAGFFTEILDFFGGRAALFDRLPRSLERVLRVARPGNLNFRSGSSDEWRRVLSAAQVRRIAEKAAGSFDGIYDL